MEDKYSLEAVTEALGKPVMAEFPEATSKIRLNLMVVSLITIAVIMLDVKVSPTNTLLGVTFEGLTTATLKVCLLLVNVYMFVHFLWCAADYLQNWRLRITGTNVGFRFSPVWNTHGTDHPPDPQQSTLYNWWRDQSVVFKNMTEVVSRLQANIDKLAAAPAHHGAAEAAQPNNSIASQIEAFKLDMNTVAQQLEVTRGIMEDQRIAASLKRFDSAFSLFLRSQNLRWLVVEAGFPLLLGGCSIFLLVAERFF